MSVTVLLFRFTVMLSSPVTVDGRSEPRTVGATPQA
ncbi:hypothetical protein J2X09_003514 [Hydrogenophaga laconesensis]|uniref:Uncharacterized protein n=1 Tax=Hydrogenophaga laconesensis TaxID=1805971 RepID=A0ABU1VE62_9BURK|nr:hypothetical protein [Hydrogenophaga laconesensis]